MFLFISSYVIIDAFKLIILIITILLLLFTYIYIKNTDENKQIHMSLQHWYSSYFNTLDVKHELMCNLLCRLHHYYDSLITSNAYNYNLTK